MKMFHQGRIDHAVDSRCIICNFRAGPWAARGQFKVTGVYREEVVYAYFCCLKHFQEWLGLGGFAHFPVWTNYKTLQQVLKEENNARHNREDMEG